MGNKTGAPVLFDPAQTTITIGNMYITGVGSTPITFTYSQDAVDAEPGLDGAVVFKVNNSQLGKCALPMKISSPQYDKLITLAKSHKMFSIWCTDKSSGRRAGGNYAVFTRVPDYAADASDVNFNMIIADLDIDSF